MVVLAGRDVAGEIHRRARLWACVPRRDEPARLADADELVGDLVELGAAFRLQHGLANIEEHLRLQHEPVADHAKVTESFELLRHIYGIPADRDNNLYLLDFSSSNIGKLDAKTNVAQIWSTAFTRSRPRRGSIRRADTRRGNRSTN